MGIFLQDMDSRTISTRLGTVRGQRRHVRLGDSGASRPTLEKRTTTEHSEQHIGIDIRILISSGLMRGTDLKTLSHNISAMNAPNQFGYLKFTIYVLQTFVADGFMVRDSCIACSCVFDGLGRSIVLSWCGLVRGVRSRSHCSCTQAHLASPVSGRHVLPACPARVASPVGQADHGNRFVFTDFTDFSTSTSTSTTRVRNHAFSVVETPPDEAA